jgi:predicted ArsR family transcriptional regulator
MSEESFLLVSLKEDKAKELAQVLTNDTSRKILDYLSKKGDATETEISKELGLPASTVNYNMKHLTQAGLVSDDKFHYSEKGKEVVHYTLTNKFVIIAPTHVEGLRDKLAKILPVVAVVAGAAYLISRFAVQKVAEPMLMAATEEAYVGDMALKAAAPMGAPSLEQTVAEPNIALWFAAGAAFSLILYFVWNFVYAKVKSKH